jgi:hypothetical protein
MSKPLKTHAKCPTCEKMHWTSRWYTGHGTPRMYCEECKQIAANLRLREQNLEAKLNLKRETLKENVIDWVDYEFGADGSLVDYA